MKSAKFGYEKKGMKTMFGKRYPNCVKKTKKEEVEIQDANGNTFAHIEDVITNEDLMSEVRKSPRKNRESCRYLLQLER